MFRVSPAHASLVLLEALGGRALHHASFRKDSILSATILWNNDDLGDMQVSLASQRYAKLHCHEVRLEGSIV